MSDCDAHGTLVASMIAAVPGTGRYRRRYRAGRSPFHDRNAATPDGDLSPVPLSQTVTVIPAPPPEEGVPRGAPALWTGAAAGSWSSRRPWTSAAHWCISYLGPQDSLRSTTRVTAPECAIASAGTTADAVLDAPGAEITPSAVGIGAFGLHLFYTGGRRPADGAKDRQRRDNGARDRACCQHGCLVINIPM